MLMQRTKMCFKIISIISGAYLFTCSFHMVNYSLPETRTHSRGRFVYGYQKRVYLLVWNLSKNVIDVYTST